MEMKLWRSAVTFILMMSVIACNLSLPSGRIVTPSPSPTPTLIPAEPSKPTPSLMAQLSAHEVVQRTAARLAELKSFHFSIRPRGNKPNVGGLLNTPLPVLLSTIEGDIVRPDQLRARVMVTILGTSAHLDLVRYQGETYLNNPLTGKWEKLPSEASHSLSPAVLFSPEQGLPTLLTGLKWNIVGFDEMQGVSTYHLQARDVPSVNLIGSGGTSEVIVDMWVGRETFLLYQIRVDEQPTKREGKTTWLLTLSAFDRPVVITPPTIQ
ncbi:MAG: LppX_LprAFG lipoprotein [Anaerolineae bacterium]|nr:LppX_LprAFG lipoprotein [Anaerolineae bacterium]